MRNIRIATLVTEWFVLRIFVGIVAYQLLSDDAPALWALWLQQLPEFVLLG
nr:MAG TPA: hypothetical protein [Caudoviricetes sp.]